MILTGRTGTRKDNRDREIFMEKKDKVYRSLDLYTRLQKGEIICKAEEAVNFGVNEKSIQRDIEDIRELRQLIGKRFYAVPLGEEEEDYEIVIEEE